jgi:hypothetical protein
MYRLNLISTKSVLHGSLTMTVLSLQESSELPTASSPRRIGHCRRRMIRRGQPSAYRLGVDLPRRRRADPRRRRSPRRTGPMPTARGTLGVLALGVAAHGNRQAKRQLGHTPTALPSSYRDTWLAARRSELGHTPTALPSA